MIAKPHGRLSALVMAALTIATVGACSSAAATPSATAGVGTSSPTSAASTGTAHNPVTISVGVLRPGVDQKTVDALNTQIAEFQVKYPWITVTPQEYNWTAPTFAAQRLAGTLPDVYTVPFTEGKGLIEQNAIVNIDSLFRALGYADKLNQNVLINGERVNADGTKTIFGVPYAAYGMSLTYNRKLFAAAGLDPDKPPTTWDEIRTDAKAIADKTKMAGFAQMATHATGGWQLTTLTSALGGRMESVDKDGKVTATVNNAATKKALQMLKDFRFTDNSMGATFDYDWGSINQAFSAGKIGMFTGGSDLYTAMTQTYKIDPAIYGITTIPLATDPNAGVLGGGTLVVVKANTSADQRIAAVDWIDYYWMSKLRTEAGAISDAKDLVANNQPVGVPSLPIFDKATYDQSQLWIKSYINVPTVQMTPFTSNINSQPLVTEPSASTQALYTTLDPVVQAVLTDKNANIDSLLNAANSQIQSILDKPAS